MKRKLRLAALLAICVLISYAGIRSLSPASTPPPAIAAAKTAVRQLPPIELMDLATGEARSIAEWEDRSLLLNFWATWCAPCRSEMPLLESLHQERAGTGPAVIGIAIDHEEPVRHFVGEVGVSYPILVGQEDAMAAAEALGPIFVGLPLTVVAAPGGEIIAMRMGELHPEHIRLILDTLDSLAAGTIGLAAARAALEAI